MPGGGRIRIGTCSWADRGLVASGWYPPSARTAAARLAFYGAAFDTVEVDSTFYAIPEQASAFQWAARTPPGFLFNVKAWGLFTWHSVKYETLPEWVRHEIPRPESGRLDFQGLPRELRPVLWKRFTSALEPLRTMDRMGYLLFQLPTKASFSPVMMRYLERVAEVTPPFRTAVEVRNRSWMEKGNRESFLSLLKGANMAYVAVDEPELDWTVGRDFPVTATWGAVARFHGRNREGWTKKRSHGGGEIPLQLLRRGTSLLGGGCQRRRGAGRQGLPHVQQLLPGLCGEKRPQDEMPPRRGLFSGRGRPGGTFLWRIKLKTLENKSLQSGIANISAP